MPLLHVLVKGCKFQMNPNDYENQIKEKRTIEASKKNLMGKSGKLGMILKHFGEPIVSQEGMFSDASYFDHFWEDVGEDEESMPTFEEGSLSHDVGRIWDGLSRGMHLEIQYMNNKKELTVYEKGYLVYKESSGELLCYVPKESWEKNINQLYDRSKYMEKDQRKKDSEEVNKEADRAKLSWLWKIRDKWGI